MADATSALESNGDVEVSDSRAERVHRLWVDPAPPEPRGKPQGTSSWSWRIGSLVGIPVRVHATFWLLLGWIALSHILQGHGVAAISAGLLLILSIFACVVLHELGHALVARRFGIGTRDITLLPIGGVAHLERMPEKPSQELVVALAGPVVSLVIAGALFAALALFNAPTGFEHLQIVGGPFLTKVMWFNVALAGFNLLPAFPMDGGRILRATLAMRMDRGRATDLAARIGQGMAVLLGIWGFFFNPVLIIIAAFVWMSAKGEASLAQLTSACRAMPVRQAMITEFRVLAPEDPLSRSVELTLTSFQQDFPVMDGDRLVGILTHDHLLEGLAKHGQDAAVKVVMRRNVATADPDELLPIAFERMQITSDQALVVVDGGQVIGLLTPRHVRETVTMGRALSRSWQGTPKNQP
jgi:Zn-dependent protease/CBS domain-containing protein